MLNESCLQIFGQKFSKTFLRDFWSFSINHLLIIAIVEKLSIFVSKYSKNQIISILFCELNMNYNQIECYEVLNLKLSPKLTTLNNNTHSLFKKREISVDR